MHAGYVVGAVVGLGAVLGVVYLATRAPAGTSGTSGGGVRVTPAKGAPAPSGGSDWVAAIPGVVNLADDLFVYVTQDSST